MLKQHSMLSSSGNITQSNSSHDKIIKIDLITKHISSFSIAQRTIFILSLIVLVWFIFILIYVLSRVIIRLITNFKRFHHHSSSISNGKMCQTFVISSNHYGSFRPIQSLYRQDSLFSNSDFALANERIKEISNYKTVNLTINHYSTIIDKLQYQQSKASLLEHYLKTYNPLQIDLTNNDEETITTSDAKVTSYEAIPSETDTHLVDNCYPLNCTNKQKLHQTRRYARLKEQENCSATISLVDDRLSECSTKLTSATLPVIMVTDCSNSHRLHTDIIEMNEEE